ncbi:MAG: MBL fold metallo-hydrolase [Anaerolineales bacterium]|nr:MBL fold metallo-hydrolase [Anaerolineales bacterium]
MIRISKFGPVTRFDLARTLTGRGRYWTTAYLLDSIMIDTGCAHTCEELLDMLSESHLTKIVNTHSHEDHIGANAALKRDNPSADILAHPQALKVLEDPHRNQPLHPYRRFFWGCPEASQGKPLVDGEMIISEGFQLQVIYTPGHSPDHLCLYEPEKSWLFTGDLFVGGKDRALRQGCDIWGVIASLKKIAALPIRYLFPGSARVRTNPTEELETKINYLEELGHKVIDLHRRGLSTGEIARLTCGTPMFVEAITLGHFTRRHLIRSYLT